jgi:SOS response regulatory protein OraA/RecX
MTSDKLKNELISLIKQEESTEILNALKTILSRNHSENVLREKLELRAKKASEEIGEGKLYTTDEVIQILNEPGLSNEL